jgi:hypothetical protein
MTLAKLRLKPTNNASVFFDFRVYKAFAKHGNQRTRKHLRIRSGCQEFSLSNGSKWVSEYPLFLSFVVHVCRGVYTYYSLVRQECARDGRQDLGGIALVSPVHGTFY